MTSASCGDPVQEFVRDVTCGPQVPAEGAYDDQQVQSQAKMSGRMLPILYPDAAGIDIGAEEIFVAVPADRDIDSVRPFGTFTRDLIALTDWLRQCNIRSVAMESTGVYWIPLYQILETHGFEVFLVNPHHVKNVPGRKSEVRTVSGS